MIQLVTNRYRLSVFNVSYSRGHADMSLTLRLWVGFRAWISSPRCLSRPEAPDQPRRRRTRWMLLQEPVCATKRELLYRPGEPNCSVGLKAICARSLILSNNSYWLCGPTYNTFIRVLRFSTTYYAELGNPYQLMPTHPWVTFVTLKHAVHPTCDTKQERRPQHHQ